MMDEFELSYGDGSEISRSSAAALEFAKEIVKWKLNDMTMFPEDVLNYMIQSNLITETEVIGIMVEVCLSDKKELDISLPKKYNI